MPPVTVFVGLGFGRKDQCTLAAGQNGILFHDFMRGHVFSQSRRSFEHFIANSAHMNLVRRVLANHMVLQRLLVEEGLVANGAVEVSNSVMQFHVSFQLEL